MPSDLTELQVFIVDDTLANVEVLRGVLELAGWRSVRSETDPRRALDAMAASRPDLVLLDWHMPGLGGEEVLGALQDVLDPDEFLPVIVLTADSTKRVREEALAAGATDFLSKPLEAIEVILRVRNLLAARAMHLRLRAQNHALKLEVAPFAERIRRENTELQVRIDRVNEVLSRRALEMVFQPIVRLDDGRVAGTEALARFQVSPQRPPDEWFAEAASVGRGTELELLAVDLAVSRIDDLPDDAYLSVNVSAATVCSAGFQAAVGAAPAHRLVVELTEHTRVDDYEEVVDALAHVRKVGVRVAVDDVGVGYAGLQHILRLAPDIIKLDRDLIQGIDLDRGRRAMAASQVAFTREVGAVLIAEGVETPGECSVLQGLGVTYGQGYLFARPGSLPLAAPSVRLPE